MLSTISSSLRVAKRIIVATLREGFLLLNTSPELSLFSPAQLEV
jgi:hypothetical protein